MEMEPMWTAAFLVTAVDFGLASKCDVELEPFVTKNVFQMLKHSPAMLWSKGLEILSTELLKK